MTCPSRVHVPCKKPGIPILPCAISGIRARSSSTSDASISQTPITAHIPKPFIVAGATPVSPSVRHLTGLGMSSPIRFGSARHDQHPSVLRQNRTVRGMSRRLSASYVVRNASVTEQQRLQQMIDELGRMRKRCEPKSNQSPWYLRYSNAVSALL